MPPSKKPLKVLHLTLMPWKWEGAVLVGGTSADFSGFAKRWIDATTEVNPGAPGHAYVEYGKPWLLWVMSLKDIPALAHEALHVTAGVLEGRGVKHCNASEEAFTYTMEDILRRTLEHKKWETVKPGGR